MEPIETIEKDGFTLKLYPDEDPESPRSYDNLGTMVCWHRRYHLGDINGKKKYGTAEDFTAWWQANGKGGVILALYLYDHSGITMSTSPFSCPWDSGQVGYIYADETKIRQEYDLLDPSKKIHADVKKRVMGVLQAEVETYDQFLTGQVYGYVIADQAGEHVGSCWGFYGFDYCKGEAETELAYWIKEYAKRDAEAQRLMAL